MMEILATMQLQKRGELLAAAERASVLAQLPNWHLLEKAAVPQLERVFVFKNFIQALAFANRIGELAETANHHPALLVEWGRVTVCWWTHSLGGLQLNDFIMAARCDLLYNPN